MILNIFILTLLFGCLHYSNQKPKLLTKHQLRTNPQPWVIAQNFDPLFEYPDNQLDFSIHDSDFHNRKKMLLVGKPTLEGWMFILKNNESVVVYRDENDNFWVEEKNAIPYLLRQKCLYDEEEKIDDKE